MIVGRLAKTVVVLKIEWSHSVIDKYIKLLYNIFMKSQISVRELTQDTERIRLVLGDHPEWQEAVEEEMRERYYDLFQLEDDSLMPPEVADFFAAFQELEDQKR